MQAPAKAQALRSIRIGLASLLAGMSLTAMAGSALAASQTASAHAKQVASHVTPLTAQCIQRQAKRNGIHEDILFAILMVEGGTVGRDSKANGNGTYDIGPFQINSMHRDKVAQLGVSEEQLRNNGCINAAVAAWHLRRVLTPDVVANIRTEDDYLRAIALYHSATPKFNIIYAEKLRKAFNRLYASDQ